MNQELAEAKKNLAQKESDLDLLKNDEENKKEELQKKVIELDEQNLVLRTELGNMKEALLGFEKAGKN